MCSVQCGKLGGIVALNNKQKLFVDEYLKDLNATQAAIRAGYSAKTASRIGPELLGKTCIKAAIAEQMKAREERTQITQDMVLRRWWELASADVNELIQYRRTCCRHCHGIDHAYQWIDEAEFDRACLSVEMNTQEGQTPLLPTNEGGYGFVQTADPHKYCPKCNGEGVGEIFAADTRKLKGGARQLYDGVKQTKDGFEVRLRDRDKALENVARHLGMFTDKLDVSITGALAERLARAKKRSDG